ATGATHDKLSAADQAFVEQRTAELAAMRTDEYPTVHQVRRVLVRRPIGARLAAEARISARLERDAHARIAALEAFAADPLGAPVPDIDAVPVEFAAMALDWFATPQLEAAGNPFPALPTEPATWPALDFTGEYRAIK